MKIAWVGLFKSIGNSEPQWIGIKQGLEILGINHKLYDYRTENPTDIRHSIAEFKPDLIIQGVSECINNATYLQDCKYYSGAIQCFQYVDVRFEIPFDRLGNGAIDYMFISNDNKEQHELWKDHIGCKDVFFMPCAYYHDMMWENDIEDGLVFIGAQHLRGKLFGQERLDYIDALRKTDIPLILLGDDYKHSERTAVLEQQANLYSSYRMALSINSVTNELEKYTSNRLFNICGTGGLALVRRFNGLDTLYKEGEHIFAFSSPEELIDIYNANRHKDHRDMRYAAWEHTMRNHTWTYRIQDMIDLVIQ